MLRSFKVFAVAVALFASSHVGAQPCCEHLPRMEVTFVSNYEELHSALEKLESGTIGSVAISEEFYRNGSVRWAQLRMLDLIANTARVGDYAVYLYSPTLDRGFAEDLLRVEALAKYCHSPIFVGKIVSTKNPEEPILLCGYGGGDATEEGIRARVEMNNERELRRLEK